MYLLGILHRLFGEMSLKQKRESRPQILCVYMRKSLEKLPKAVAQS